MNATPARFTGVHLFVRDMAATVAFYRALGLTVDSNPELSRATVSPGPDLVFGSHDLTLRYDPKFQLRAGSACALQFVLATRAAVDDLYGKLVHAGYKSHLSPFDAFWGARYAEVEDPDGVIVGFHSPQDEARRTAIP